MLEGVSERGVATNLDFKVIFLLTGEWLRVYAEKIRILRERRIVIWELADRCSDCEEQEENFQSFKLRGKGIPLLLVVLSS